MPKQATTAVDESRRATAEAEPKPTAPDADSTSTHSQASRPSEYGGRKGPDPVRYGDWEKNGRCIDF